VAQLIERLQLVVAPAKAAEVACARRRGSGSALIGVEKMLGDIFDQKIKALEDNFARRENDLARREQVADDRDALKIAATQAEVERIRKNAHHEASISLVDGIEEIEREFNGGV
jgi:hypothetical protein